MQGKRKNSYEGKHSKKRSGSGVRTGWLVCAAALTVGGVLTVHIVSNQRQAEPDSFHISSNYLEEADSGAAYTVSDWGSGFDIHLYNCEKEDISRISEVDMSYTVTADNAEISVREQNGEAVEADPDGVYLFGTEAVTAYHILHVTPDSGGNGPVKVTVQTALPRQKTLTAEFQVQSYRKPDYTVTEQNNRKVLIRVNSNDYQDSITVKWDPEKFSPDNSNELMASWTDVSGVGHFPVSRDSSYELMFNRKTDAPYTEQSGADTEITLD